MEQAGGFSVQINDLRKEHELLDIFCSLAEIPSPSLHEEDVIKYIEQFCKDNNLDKDSSHGHFKRTYYVIFSHGCCWG